MERIVTISGFDSARSLTRQGESRHLYQVIMRSFDETHFRTVSTGSDRLETPATVGVRPGMTCSGLIARKLGTIYEVGPSLPSAMEVALKALDRCLDQKRRA